jgi:2-amino-4-hydroxy-6-hydroxymethyldihydropteridine diphosphokinase
MVPVFLGLGTNLGDRTDNLRGAVAALAQFTTVKALSSVWETAPLYVVDQPAFLNMALHVTTALAPLDLLARLKALEDALGRIKSIRFGPRLIDLDILFHGQTVMDSDILTLPHPRLGERRFALAPLAEIAGELIHPVCGLSIEDMLAQLPESDDIRRIGPL